MENVHEMHFSIGTHECVASVSASTANLALAVLVLSIPSTGQFTLPDYHEYQRQKLLAVQWAQQLVGTTPLVIEPDHGSGPPRRRGGAG